MLNFVATEGMALVLTEENVLWGTEASMFCSVMLILALELTPMSVVDTPGITCVLDV